jgi:hypothetical protein
MKRISLWLWLVLGVAQVQAESRTWTNSSGKTIQAEFGGVSAGQVKLMLAEGKQASVPLASLSAEDQAWIRIQPAPASNASRVPAEKRRMPDQVKEPLLYTTIRVVREEPGNCLYESGHFQFKTTAKLGVALMKDVCRAFESTYELVRLMPWGIQPKPEEGRTKFQAELYETRQQYLATGAPSWSAGVYSLKDKVFRIPFGELGISDQPGAGGAYYRKGEINNDTITHEITHQMMHEYVPYMPAWLVEGLAEYTSNLPYRGGVFQLSEDGSIFETKLAKPSRRRGLFAISQPKPSWVGVKKVWTLTTDITRPNPMTSFLMPEESAPSSTSTAPRQLIEPNLADIASHYHSGHLLTYFFVRDRDGLPLKKYFDAIHAEIPKWPPFWKALDQYTTALEKLRPAYDAYATEMKAFLLKPGVKQIGDGKISFPSNLTPPVSPPQAPEPPLPPERTNPGAVCIKHLDILLDGRSVDQVEEETGQMFQKLGYPF